MSTVVDLGYIRGPQGETGPQGPQGIQGVKGDKGDTGDPFAIAKIYPSISAMNSGYATDGVKIGGFVLIDTGSVEDPDTGKLYVKGNSAYQYLTDLSGSQGIQGPKGDKGDQGIQGVQGIQGIKGDKGDTGAQGPKGDKGDKWTYSELTDAEKQELKQDITTINAIFTSTYNVTGPTTSVPINIAKYHHGTDILEVYVNGLKRIEGIDYTTDGTNITFTETLNVIGQVHIVCTKSVSAVTSDLASFKGDKGDKGDQGIQGPQGIQGVGIKSVVQTTTSPDDAGENVITVTKTDNTTSTFKVKNGSKGSQGIQGVKGDKGDKGDTPTFEVGADYHLYAIYP